MNETCHGATGCCYNRFEFSRISGACSTEQVRMSTPCSFETVSTPRASAMRQLPSSSSGKTSGEFNHFPLSHGRQNFLLSYFHALRGCWPLPAGFEYKRSSLRIECGDTPLGKWMIQLELPSKEILSIVTGDIAVR